ncbi:hypothetical protein BH11PSE11_BH11PSE11_16530 [soil metagenome]
MMFEESKCATDKKLANFSKYVRRQTIARFLVQNELFRLQLQVKGSIVECGVHHGGGVMTWAKLSSTLEPYNYHRQIIGFDTFEGFPSVTPIDVRDRPEVKEGMFAEAYDTHDELLACVKEYDENRFLNHVPKVQLVRGDANLTIPDYVSKNPHLLISMLYLDFDVYEPTVTALKTLLPRMPKGAVLAFDEVNNPHWAGETMALLEELDIRQTQLRCFEYEPNISYLIL